MIEINLFSVGDSTSMYGRCISRARIDTESIGTSALEFTKGFLKDNLDNIQGGVGSELTSLINSDMTLTTKDFASLNYLLGESGYQVKIWTVADDEENAETVPAGVVEWNVIDNNYTQNDYPTTTKVVPSEAQSMADVIKSICDQVDLFDEDKFSGIKNPVKDLLKNLDDTMKITGSVASSSVTKIYQILSQCGVDIFCALSE